MPDPADVLEHPPWCDRAACTADMPRAAGGGRIGSHVSPQIRLVDSTTAVQLVQSAAVTTAAVTAPMVRVYDLSRGRRFTTAPLDELLQALSTLSTPP